MQIRFYLSRKVSTLWSQISCLYYTVYLLELYTIQHGVDDRIYNLVRGSRVCWDLDEMFRGIGETQELVDSKNRGGVNEETDLFLASVGCVAIKTISVMVFPKTLEDFTVEEIVDIVQKKKKDIVQKRNWS